MSTSWPERGQPQWYSANAGGGFQTASFPAEERLPICFNCGNEGHFVIACPEPIKTNLAGLAPARAPDGADPLGSGGSAGAGFQRPYWANGHNGAVVTRYPVPKAAPVVTRYPVPQPPQTSGGAYGHSETTYQQYASSGSNPQGYQAQVPQAHATHPAHSPSQAYGVPGPVYNQAHQQAIQPYTGSQMSYQYGQQGYQPPSYNQYAQYTQQNATPRYAQYPQHQSEQFGGLPSGELYQQFPNAYPVRIPDYGENYRRSSGPSSYKGSPNQTNQWSAPAPLPTSQTGPSVHRQQSASSQHDVSYHREFSGTPSLPMPTQEHSYQQTPQTPASNHSHQLVRQELHHSPANIYGASQSSSRASTPYRCNGSIFNGASAGPGHNSASPSSREPDWTAKTEGQGEDGEGDADIFKWEFKKIFNEPEKQETVALAQPLSTTFDMTPVPLLNSRSTNSVSRYARKENLREFVRSIRDAPQWSYLKEDPAFAESEGAGPLVLLRELPAWMAARHGIEDVPSSRQGGKKRAWSDEQEDVDNQIILESAFMAEDDDPSCDARNAEPQCKRQKNDSSSLEQSNGGASIQKSGTPIAAPGTPVYVRDGTPSCDPEDDIWAPQPGEGADSVSVNPTEALLASLGVSGSPKPVNSAPAPPPIFVGGDDHFRPPDLQRRSSSFAKHSTGNDPLTTPPIGPLLPPNSTHPNNAPYTGPHHAMPQYGNVTSPIYPGLVGGPHHHGAFSNGPQGYPYNGLTAHQQAPRNTYHNVPQPHTYGPPLHTQFANNYMSRPPIKNQFSGSGQPDPSPMRQDSGYVSAREAHGNGESNESFPRCNSQIGSHEYGPASKCTSSSAEPVSKENKAPKMEADQDADAESGESPLSPTSAEILGKLLPTNNTGKKETQRQVDHTMKKRRQPVVAEAYSRRW